MPVPATTTKARATTRLVLNASSTAPTATITLAAISARRAGTLLSTLPRGKRPNSWATPRAPASDAAVEREIPPATIAGTCNTISTEAPNDPARADTASLRTSRRVSASRTAAAGEDEGEAEAVSLVRSTVSEASTNTTPTANAPRRRVSRHPTSRRDTSVRGISTGEAKAPHTVRAAIALASEPGERRATTLWVRW